MSRIGALVKRLYGEELKSAGAGSARRGVGRRAGRWGGLRTRLGGLRRSLDKRRVMKWAIRIAAVGLVLGVLLEGMFQYNRLTASYTTVLARRADVDREFQRRMNLIPSLVSAVSGYASYEQGVFKYVADAREQLKALGDREPPAELNSVLGQLSTKLLALAEEYPDLQTSKTVQDLIKEVSVTEDRIAEAKSQYNKASEIYNQYRTVFPGNVFALLYGFTPTNYIGLEEHTEVPGVQLDVSVSK